MTFQKIITVLVVSMLAIPAYCATIHVDLTSTYDQTLPDVGTTWVKAHTSLASALADAAVGDQLQLAEGTYYPESKITGCIAAPYLVRDGISVLGGYPAGGGTRDITTHFTIISGDINFNGVWDHTDASVLFQINAVDATLAALLDGLNFEHAATALRSGNGKYIMKNCAFREFGTSTGILHNVKSEFSLQQCVFEDNQVVSTIAALIYSDHSIGDVVNSRFEDNSSVGFQVFGGCVWYSLTSSCSFTNSVFHNNDCTSDRIPDHLPVTSTLDLINCSFLDNDLEAPSDATPVYATAKVHNCILYHNSTFEMLFESTAAGQMDALYSSVPAAYQFLDVSLISADPLFVLGGLTIPAGSPAVDAGDNALNSEISDILGDFRVSENTSCDIDMGAYEVQVTNCGGNREYVDPGVVPFQVSLFPNPTNGNFQLNVNEPLDNIDLLDLQGKVIKTIPTNGDQYIYNVALENQAAGIYWLRLESKDRIETRKLVVY